MTGQGYLFLHKMSNSLVLQYFILTSDTIQDTEILLQFWEGILMLGCINIWILGFFWNFCQNKHHSLALKAYLQ